MNLGEKIQKLRKDNGLSQEQLAEKLKVSRQALSKWELGASLPEVDKIVLLSDYFKVSTDYLLKDELDKEVTINQNCRTLNRHTAITVSSAIVLIGLMVGWARANTGAHIEYLPFSLAAPGMIVQVIGIVCFEILNMKQKDNKDKASRFAFYGINIWFFAVLPAIFIVGRYFHYIVGSYPGLLSIIYMVMTYLVVSCAVSLLCLILYRNASKKQ